jgi:hypothetical protein
LRFKLAMLRLIRRTLTGVGLFCLWTILSALFALAAYQLYATLIFIGIRAIENPKTRPVGWNTATLSGLSKLLILVLGGVWLFVVSSLERYLRQGQQAHDLRRRAGRLILCTAVVWGASYGLLLLLS